MTGRSAQATSRLTRRRRTADTALERLRRKARPQRTSDETDLYYQALADQVSERRLELELSQRELAELCGTTQSAIARLERGGRPPRIDTLLRIAQALDCELLVELRPRTKTSEER
jgi:ribosome-binding protein aMBF1 (putative translation factor)